MTTGAYVTDTNYPFVRFLCPINRKIVDLTDLTAKRKHPKGSETEDPPRRPTRTYHYSLGYCQILAGLQTRNRGLYQLYTASNYLFSTNPMAFSRFKSGRLCKDTARQAAEENFARQDFKLTATRRRPTQRTLHHQWLESYTL